MEYEPWRDDVFGQPSGSDPVMVCLPDETCNLPHTETLDHIDQALVDPEIHQRYSRDQIDVGLQLIYSNCCSSICLSYVEVADQPRCLQAVRNLVRLYDNFFSVYCTTPVARVGYEHLEGPLGYLCYMFWDIFVLHPGNSSPDVIAAALDVMAYGVQSGNDNCIVSALHGLGHWGGDTSHAVEIVRQWLRQPSTQNPVVLQYAQQALTGCIQ